MFWHVAVGMSFVKAVLWPCYSSTDFEVHRNWLAVTHSLPLTQWYTDATSIWTLDYPPLFAWFEWLLSHLAVHVDPAMVKLHNLNYKSFETVMFQRLSVILTDWVLVVGVKLCADSLGHVTVRRRQDHLCEWPLLILTNAGLLLVDHIHFQYNGFLFGVLLISVAAMLRGNYLTSAATFVLLLNLKHIFLYCAPAYAVYLFFSFCFRHHQPGSFYANFMAHFSLARLILLASVVITGFALSFGPLIAAGQLPQVLSRLFPFKRGLTHAYWAPNFWALYNAADLVLSKVLPGHALEKPSGLTGGLVQHAHFRVLPDISPAMTFLLTLLFQAPILYKLARCPKQPLLFVRALTMCSFASFMFGWHVHEKAILMVVVPMSLLAMQTSVDARSYFSLSSLATLSLLPLLHEQQESVIKVLALVLQVLVTNYCLRTSTPSLGPDQWCVAVSMGLVWLCPWVWLFVLHPDTAARYTFLPLMLYSTVCASGLLVLMIRLYRHCFSLMSTAASL